MGMLGSETAELFGSNSRKALAETLGHFSYHDIQLDEFRAAVIVFPIKRGGLAMRETAGGHYHPAELVPFVAITMPKSPNRTGMPSRDSCAGKPNCVFLLRKEIEQDGVQFNFCFFRKAYWTPSQYTFSLSEG